MPISDIDEQNQETFESLTDKVLVLIAPKVPSLKSPIPFKIHLGINLDSQIYQKHLNSELTQEQIQTLQLQTALENPDQLEGAVKMAVNGKTILWVEDGEIIQDDFAIIPKFVLDNTMQSLDDVCRKIAGQELLPFIKHMLKICGEKNHEGELVHSGKNYVYTEKDDFIKVVTKCDGREILNSHGFTLAASNKDITAMHSFKQVAQEIATSQNLTNPQPKFKI